uniref:Uncharacterized protein n=1 Tax=Setaria italica TaxID=4555 RepID=K3XZS7_SETIT
MARMTCETRALCLAWLAHQHPSPRSMEMTAGLGHGPLLARTRNTGTAAWRPASCRIHPSLGVSLSVSVRTPYLAASSEQLVPEAHYLCIAHTTTWSQRPHRARTYTFALYSFIQVPKAPPLKSADPLFMRPIYYYTAQNIRCQKKKS